MFTRMPEKQHELEMSLICAMLSWQRIPVAFHNRELEPWYSEMLTRLPLPRNLFRSNFVIELQGKKNIIFVMNNFATLK